MTDPEIGPKGSLPGVPPSAPTLQDISDQAARHSLMIVGGFTPDPGDGAPSGTCSLLMLGPKEPGFWAHFTAQPEWGDGLPDPMDRWSRRVIGTMACDLGAKAVFPFGGPPHHPFFRWALKTGRIWESPVRLLVHAEQGLFISFRGALALKHPVDLPLPMAPPCTACDRPCLTACPATALTGGGYDVPACHSYLATPKGDDCMDQGCAVRRACPVSHGYARMPEQSAYHMEQFHR
jgi:epoxyqueuosine reductase